MQLSGPAGGAIWNSPTIDVKKHLIYAGIGNGYTEPAAQTTDAIMAFDMQTGKIAWDRPRTLKTTHGFPAVAEQKKAKIVPKTSGPTTISAALR